MNSNAHEAAYPTVKTIWSGWPETYSDGGLTKREHFAVMAMQGLLANPGGPVQRSEMSGWQSCVNCSHHGVACEAVEFADALLAQLAKEQTP